MGVNNIGIQINKPSDFVSENPTGEIKLTSNQTKKVSVFSKFSSFMKDLYAKVVHSEAVRSFVSIFGHVALNMGESMALRKVTEVIKENFPQKEALYCAVANEALGQTTLFAKNILPHGESIPEELFNTLCDSLADYQIDALKREHRMEREQKISEAMNETI